MAGEQQTFQRRLSKHHDELKWLYMELYHNEDMFAELCTQMYEYDQARRKELKKRDLSFSKDESELVLDIMTEGMSPQEKQKINMLRNFL